MRVYLPMRAPERTRISSIVPARRGRSYGLSRRTRLRATRRSEGRGQRPWQRTATRAPRGARTLTSRRSAPRRVRLPAMRTTGQGEMRLSRATARGAVAGAVAAGPPRPAVLAPAPPTVTRRDAIVELPSSSVARTETR